MSQASGMMDRTRELDEFIRQSDVIEAIDYFERGQMVGDQHISALLAKAKSEIIRLRRTSGESKR